MGETGDSGHNPRLDGSAKNAISPANLAVILKQPSRIAIRADNRRFRQNSLRHFRPFFQLIFSNANTSRICQWDIWFHWKSARILKAASSVSSGGLSDQNQQYPTS